MPAPPPAGRIVDRAVLVGREVADLHRLERPLALAPAPARRAKCRAARETSRDRALRRWRRRSWARHAQRSEGKASDDRRTAARRLHHHRRRPRRPDRGDLPCALSPLDPAVRQRHEPRGVDPVHATTMPAFPTGSPARNCLRRMLRAGAKIRRDARGEAGRSPGQDRRSLHRRHRQRHLPRALGAAGDRRGQPPRPMRSPTTCTTRRSRAACCAIARSATATR